MPDGRAPHRGHGLLVGPESRADRQPCLGQVVSLDEHGRPEVRFPGLHGPAPVARLIGAVSPALVQAALDDGRPVLLAFLEGRGDSPVIMSLASQVDLGPAPQPDPAPDPDPELAPSADLTQVEVDGEVQVIEADSKLVLRCGKASIELHADGKIEILGRDITTWARRRQRIRGGSVAIN